MTGHGSQPAARHRLCCGAVRTADSPQPRASRRRVVACIATIVMVASVAIVTALVSASASATGIRPVIEPFDAVLVHAPPPAEERPAPLSEPQRCAPEPTLTARAAAPPVPADLLRLAREQPLALGSASIGWPTRGALWGAVQLRESEGIQRAGDHGWGTETVILSIERAVREVRRCFAGTPALHVGDIARRRGGWLRPHRSHQSGLDADIGYYYRGGSSWYVQVTTDNLDVARSWALIRALVEGGNVEMMFIDRRVQALLRAHVATLPVDQRRDVDLFQTAENKSSLIRHERGHTAHFHVRFSDPAAMELGQLLPSVLPELRATWFAPRPRKAAPKASRPPSLQPWR